MQKSMIHTQYTVEGWWLYFHTMLKYFSSDNWGWLFISFFRNDTTYFISFEFWIMTSISGRPEYRKTERLFHLEQREIPQYWVTQNLCMTTFFSKEFLFSILSNNGLKRHTHMCLAFHSIVAKLSRKWLKWQQRTFHNYSWCCGWKSFIFVSLSPLLLLLVCQLSPVDGK